MDQLETIYQPKALDVTVGGETISVKALTVGQIPAFARAIRPCAPALQGGGADWLALLADHGDAMIDSVGIATGLDVEHLYGLPPDEFVALASAVMEVNMDFFVRRLAPTVSAAAEKMIAASGAGAMPSKH